MNNKEQSYSEEKLGYRERLMKQSNEELIKTFNGQGKIFAWNRHRSIYISELQAEMRTRDWDISEVNGFGGFKCKNGLKLEGNKVVSKEK